MNHQSQFSMIASAVLHILGLLILAGVKMYQDESVQESIPVTFVAEQKTARLRRVTPVRPMLSLGDLPRRHSPEYYVVDLEHRSPAELGVKPLGKPFSEVKSLGQELFQDTGIQHPPVRYGDGLSRPMVGALLNKPYLRGIQIQPPVSEGHDLLGDIKSVQAKPDISIIDKVLARFLSAVRRKIQSKKHYPVAARNAGIEGRSGVRMVILKDGRLGKADIAESSGYEILDRAALQSVRDAAPFPPIPDAARLDRIEISIHLIFKFSGGNS